MFGMEPLLFWGSVYCYAAVTIMLLVGFVFSKERMLHWSRYVLLPGFLMHSAVFIYRWGITGYFPSNGEYENGISAGWFAILLTLILNYKKGNFRAAGMITVPVTLLALGYGYMVNAGGQPHAASLKSSWLIIHVLFAQLAFGAYLVASGLGLIYVLKDNKQRLGLETVFYNRFPTLPLIDEMMFKFVVFGFVADAIMIAAGSIWAKDLWGSYWAWDPVEVWSLLSWLIYGLTIHLRVTLGWRGRRLAWIFIFAIIGIIIAFWGVDAVVKSGQHAFGIKSIGGKVRP